MLVISKNNHEIGMIVEEFEKFNVKWNQRLNKKKSEILTNK
jgi:hypothetical protein